MSERTAKLDSRQAFGTNGRGKPIYRALCEHQVSEEWELRDFVTELQRWKGILTSEFKLQVEEISLCVDWLHWRRYGHFRYGHNGFGLAGEVAINRRYLDRPSWKIIGTLLHELLHAWQDRHGRPGRGNYHNAEFRAKAERYGLIIDSRGYTEYAPQSPFTALLEKHGVEFPEFEKPTTKEGAQRTKLKKWSCCCEPPINIRAAVPIEAQCLRCGQLFRRS